MYTYSCGLLAAGIVGGLLHGHRGSVPGRLLGARFSILLGGSEETEETVFKHFVFRRKRYRCVYICAKRLTVSKSVRGGMYYGEGEEEEEGRRTGETSFIIARPPGHNG